MTQDFNRAAERQTNRALEISDQQITSPGATLGRGHLV